MCTITGQELTDTAVDWLRGIVVTRAGKWLRKNAGFFRFFYLLVKFYTDHIKFHILIVICEFCYILQKTLRQREMYRMLEILCPVLFVH